MKTLIFSKYNQLAILFVLTSLAGVLLMTRIKITQSFFLLFLIWNLFLAAVPYAITFLIQLKPNWFRSIPLKVITYALWLLFLPNAPYIVSDFTHLHWTSGSLWLLDTILITAFALSGLLFMRYSIRDMRLLFFSALSRKQTLFYHLILCLLIGFGIYLGRYLRWNSWDILQDPLLLGRNILQLILHPIQHYGAWTVTVMYAILSASSVYCVHIFPLIR